MPTQNSHKIFGHLVSNTVQATTMRTKQANYRQTEILTHVTRTQNRSEDLDYQQASIQASH